MPRNPNCTLCELHRSSKNVCIWGSGDGDGFAIGEAPGKAEASTGKPFQGDAGKLLRPILDEFGINDPFITNVAKCRPPKNRKPEPDEIRACKPYLLEEIETRNPKAILLLGATAMKACIGKTGITDMNGQVVEKDGRTYVCCFHPAYILRDPSKEAAMRMAIGRYAAVLQGTFDRKMPAYRVVDSSSIDEFIDSWVQADTIAFDIESTGLSWWMHDLSTMPKHEPMLSTTGWYGKGEQELNFDINSIAFSLRVPLIGEENWVLPLAKSPVLSRGLRQEFLSQLSKSTEGKRIIAQNGKYDNLCLMKVYGVRFHLDSDTILAHHLIDENSAHGLKILARQFCGAPDYDLTTKEKKGLTGTKKLFGYNAADASYTRRLDDVFPKKMDEEERWLYEKVVMPSARAFEEIESNGLYVDLDFLAKSEAEAHKQMLIVEKKLNKIAGKTINWNSPAQVAEILYNKLGLTPTVFTDGGAPSTGEAALVDLDHPVSDLLEEYRGHQKFRSTYTGELQDDGSFIGGWRDYMVGPHLYLPTKITGTVTGRYSSRLHQTPRDGAIRQAITAPPGWMFAQLDLSQAELRAIAIVSRDPEMLACFKAGKDIHWRTLIAAIESGGGEYVDLVYETARQLTKKKLTFPEAIELVHRLGEYDPEKAVRINKNWKEGRKKAKGINFGFCFDQSPQGFIAYAKTKYGFEPTLQESTAFHAAYFNLYRSLSAWHDRQRKLARADGFVRCMSGRKRRLPGIYSSDRSVVAECERQAINSPIQGFVGDYKAMILVELNNSFSRDQLRIVGEVHDAILMWIKNECVRALTPQVHQIAEHPKLARECGLDFPIPMAVDIELGRWGGGTRWRP
jgi:DNA polymerase-1